MLFFRVRVIRVVRITSLINSFGVICADSYELYQGRSYHAIE